jgi:hypothetical protein
LDILDSPQPSTRLLQEPRDVRLLSDSGQNLYQLNRPAKYNAQSTLYGRNKHGAIFCPLHNTRLLYHPIAGNRRLLCDHDQETLQGETRSMLLKETNLN